MTAHELVRASRVDREAIAAGSKGLWVVRHQALPTSFDTLLWKDLPPAITSGLPPGGEYVALTRYTDSTLYSGGEVVMDDTPREVRRHLPILLRAEGRVLVSGLGLGCVVRGLAAKPEVEHVDVVEIDPDVIELCGAEWEGHPKVTVHEGDAETFPWPAGKRWDYAWHDVWSDEELLHSLHVRLLGRYQLRARVQGAWTLHRAMKRLCRRRRLPFELVG